MPFNINTWLALTSTIIACVSLVITISYWRKQFRPIITAAVVSHSTGNNTIAYNLQILNSGSIPAKNISIETNSNDLNKALGAGATQENKNRFLSCFFVENIILILQNNETVSCSFGYASLENSFWQPKSRIPITIKYQGWFGKKYKEDQIIKIQDSNSFTGHYWDPKGSRKS